MAPRSTLIVLGALALAGASWVGASQPVAGVPPAAIVAPPAKVAAKAAPKAVEKPSWNELNHAQQAALEPLAAEWDKLEGLRKKKWLEIANRFASMKPDEQQRMHERMRDWVKLTPEQRRTVRENYTRSKKFESSEKSAQWQQYQQLPEEQKQKLAADAANKKQLANLPYAAQNKAKPIPPIKSRAANQPLSAPVASAPSTATPANLAPSNVK
ncbi:putative Fe-S protein YdhL (DUF1289 family) [Oxalobacteraceae bacterium GrIS 1.11]